MAIELKVPEVGESVVEVEIGEWRKAEGDRVRKGETVVEIETDKVTVELPAPASGTLARIVKKQGEEAEVGDVIGMLEEADERPGAASKEERPQRQTRASAPAKEEERPKKRPAPEREETEKTARVMPAAQRLLNEHDLSADEVAATGPGGRLLKEDVQRHVEHRAEAPAETPSAAADGRAEEVVRMSPLRRRVSARLVEAQRTAALLTTFNEVDMSATMALRREHQEAFSEKYGVKLGFMSFFVKACVDALKQFPRLNAEVRGDDIVYRNYQDISVAVSTDKGLVVPVLRNAHRLSFAEIELALGDFARRARENQLTIEELEGGTFTITNGGVFGSLLSTPIINPPQSGVLGMHRIEERPVARDGQVVIRPMMYVALTYDHRIVDGREAVLFLRRVKECVETPPRMLIEI